MLYTLNYVPMTSRKRESSFTESLEAPRWAGILPSVSSDRIESYFAIQAIFTGSQQPCRYSTWTFTRKLPHQDFLFRPFCDPSQRIDRICGDSLEGRETGTTLRVGRNTRTNFKILGEFGGFRGSPEISPAAGEKIADRLDEKIW